MKKGFYHGLATIFALIFTMNDVCSQTSFPARRQYYVKSYSNWFSYDPAEPTPDLTGDPDSALDPLLGYSSGLEGRSYTFIREDASALGAKGVTYNLNLVNSDYPNGVDITVQAYIGIALSCPNGFYLANDQCFDSVTQRAECPTGTIYDSSNGCVTPPPPPPACKKNALGTCQEPNKEPDPCASTPMPIHMQTGNK